MPNQNPDLAALVAQGARFVGALRPVWREVARSLPRGRGRRYFAFAVGIVGVAIAGAYVMNSIRNGNEGSADPVRPTRT